MAIRRLHPRLNTKCMDGTMIVDWPIYRAKKIAEWLDDLERIEKQMNATSDLGLHDDLEALREALIQDIDNYEWQQQTEGH